MECADHGTQQWGAGEVPERRIEVELLEESAFQLVDALHILVVEPGRPVPGGAERPDALVVQGEQAQFFEALGAEPVRGDGERTYGHQASGQGEAVYQAGEPAVRLLPVLLRHFVEPVDQEECPTIGEDPSRPAGGSCVDHQTRHPGELGGGGEAVALGAQAAQGDDEGHESIELGESVVEGSRGCVGGQPPDQRGLARAGVPTQKDPGAGAEQLFDLLWARAVFLVGRREAPVVARDRGVDGRPAPGTGLGTGLQAQIGGVEVPFRVVPAEFVQSEDLRLAVLRPEGLPVLLLVVGVVGVGLSESFQSGRGDVVGSAGEPVQKVGIGEDEPRRYALHAEVVAPLGYLLDDAEQCVARVDRAAGEPGEGRWAAGRFDRGRLVEREGHRLADDPGEGQYGPGVLVGVEFLPFLALDAGKADDLAVGQRSVGGDLAHRYGGLFEQPGGA